MTGWIVLGVVVWTVAVFTVGFFVGGKNKERLMRAAGLVKDAAGNVINTIRDTGKKF